MDPEGPGQDGEVGLCEQSKVQVYTTISSTWVGALPHTQTGWVEK